MPGSKPCRATAAQIDAADPYLFMALLNKQVVHPGGAKATEEALTLAQLTANQQVLAVGCGVGTTPALILVCPTESVRYSAVR